jgi:hypothetical protein
MSNIIDLIVTAFKELPHAEQFAALQQLMSIHASSPAAGKPASKPASKRAAKVLSPEEAAQAATAAAKRKDEQADLVSVLLKDYKETPNIPYESYLKSVAAHDPTIIEKGQGKQLNIVYYKLISAKLSIIYKDALIVGAEWRKGNFITAVPAPVAAPVAAPAAAPAAAAKKPLPKKKAVAAAAPAAAAAAPAPVAATSEDEDTIYFSLNGKNYLRILPENYAFLLDAEGNPLDGAGYFDPLTEKFDTSRPCPPGLALV